MHSPTPITIVILVLGCARIAAAEDASCRDVHVFLARGNNEPYPGRQGVLAAAICAGLTSCDYEDVQFYNPLESNYCDSVYEGAINGVKQVTAYNERCPSSKLVLSGYSQGAQVIGDVLGGGGGVFFQGCVQGNTPGLDPSVAPGNKIVAATVFGDTRHTAGQSYNVLSGAGNQGLFPRSGTELDNLNRFAPVLRNYCSATDPICAGGSNVADHLNYFDLYTNDAAAWIQSMIGAAAESSLTSTLSTAPFTTSTSPSTSSFTSVLTTSSTTMPTKTSPTTISTASSVSTPTTTSTVIPTASLPTPASILSQPFNLTSAQSTTKFGTSLTSAASAASVPSATSTNAAGISRESAWVAGLGISFLGALALV